MYKSIIFVSLVQINDDFEMLFTLWMFLRKFINHLVWGLNLPHLIQQKGTIVDLTIHLYFI